MDIGRQLTDLDEEDDGRAREPKDNPIIPRLPSSLLRPSSRPSSSRSNADKYVEIMNFVKERVEAETKGLKKEHRQMQERLAALEEQNRTSKSRSSSSSRRSSSGGKGDQERREIRDRLTDEGGHREYEVERIDGERQIGGLTEFLVKWKGYPAEERTWEPMAHLDHSQHAIYVWRNKASSSKVAGGRG